MRMLCLHVMNLSTILDHKLVYYRLMDAYYSYDIILKKRGISIVL